MGVSRAVVALLIASTSTFTMAQTGGLTCSSDDGGYRYCRADADGATAAVIRAPRLLVAFWVP
jgi:hypothetical protein